MLCADAVGDQIHTVGWRLRGRVVQSPANGANKRVGSEAGLSEAKGIRRQPPATGERRACEW